MAFHSKMGILQAINFENLGIEKRVRQGYNILNKRADD